MNAFQQETNSGSLGVRTIDSQEQVTQLCRAAIDSLNAAIENVRVRDVIGQLREATNAAQTIKNLWEVLEQPSRAGSISLNSVSAAAKPKTVVVCDTQPIVAEGLRTLLNSTPDIKVQATVSSLSELTAIMQSEPPSMVMVDRAFGMHPVLNWLSELKSISASDPASSTKIVVWGPVSTPEESFRLLNAGAKAILCKTDAAPKILECLRAAAGGSVWIGESGPREPLRPRSRLSSREQQILELIKCGLKNRDIAQELGIREGTVKIHLRNIFEKTGVRSRHALAIKNLCEQDSQTLGLNAAV